MKLPLLVDLEELVGSCDEAIEKIIGSQTAEDAGWRLEDFRDALKTVRGIRIALKDWVEQAKKMPVGDLGAES